MGMIHVPGPALPGPGYHTGATGDAGDKEVALGVPVQVLPLSGQALIGAGYLSHAGLLQKGLIGYVALTCGHGFPDRKSVV